MAPQISVLHVDDDAEIAEMTQRFLSLENDRLEVTYESDAREALALLRGDPDAFDCVVSDFDMPRMTGLEFLEGVRDSFPDIPFILFTGKGSEEIAAEAISAGVTEYIEKQGPEQYPVLANRIENVVSQHRAERRVDQSQRTYETLATNFPDGLVFMFDENLRYTLVEGQGFSEVDRAPESLVGEPVEEAFADKHVEVIREQFRAALAGEANTLDLVYQGRLYRIQTLPVRDDGEIFAGMAVAQDITATEETRAEKLEAQRKIERLHDIASRLERCETEAAIYDLTVEAAEQILEFTICYIGIVEDGQIVPQATNAPELGRKPTILPADEGIAGKTFQTGDTYIVEDAGSNPDAQPVEDEYRSALSIPFGEVGVFQAVSTTPNAFSETDRELGELLVSHAVQAFRRVNYEADLRAERDRFAALFKHVQDAAVHYEFEDRSPVIKAVNPAFERVFGFEAEMVEGKPVDEVIIPNGHEAEATKFNERIRSGAILNQEVERRTSGGIRHFLLRNAPIPAVSGEQRGYAIYTDITELKRRERALSRQNEKLEQFASIVSHDLRNPLNVAQGNLSMAIESGDMERADAAVTALGRMEQLISDLLDLAKQGQSVQEMTQVTLLSVVQNAWRTTDVPADVDLQTEEDLGRIDADVSRLRQLFENLFRNAIDHGMAEERGLTIRVGRIPNGFFVEDDGVGIPPDRRDRVLESGVTTSEDGTGFGLAIVDQIVAAHGWSLSVGESREGGARFEIEGVARPTVSDPNR